MTFTEASLNYETSQCDTFHYPKHNHKQSFLLSHHAEIAKKILIDVMQFRRLSDPQTACDVFFCQKCHSPHLSKIISAVCKGTPVAFALPAFPGKSPNSAKVLGPLPDMAERCALEFLQHLCDRIQQYYSPGAQIVLCSDGRVFSDVVGMKDEDVTKYQDEISKMIKSLGLTSISTFNMDELYIGSNFDDMRSQLMKQYGEPVDILKASVSRGSTPNGSTDDKETHRLYCGITRFLVEDAMFPGQNQSRSSLQKECRIRAYTVIQRSKAWGELVENTFPDAVRLSIHPQSCGSKKLGIRLIEPDNWQTPWHGVAVQIDGKYVLLKRSQAEALGAHLVYRFGRPSHYVLTDKKQLSKFLGANEVENED
ncbi:MAG: L-tyrosine/L-tryptophan isonitrile synthase family protein [Pseudobdellovibrionaceae bacterium]